MTLLLGRRRNGSCRGVDKISQTVLLRLSGFAESTDGGYGETDRDGFSNYRFHFCVAKAREVPLNNCILTHFETFKNKMTPFLLIGEGELERGGSSSIIQ